MGCGASNNAATPAVAATINKASNSADASPPASASSGKPAPVRVRAADDATELSQIESLAAEPESPTTVRISDKKKKVDPFADDIMTICEDDPASPPSQGTAGAGMEVAKSAKSKPGAKTDTASRDLEHCDSTDPRLKRDWSTKADAPQLITLGVDADGLAPPPPPQQGGGTWGPDDKVVLRGAADPSAQAAQGAAKRYEDLTLSDDDSDDESGGFDLHRWKRFYHWNRRKHSDLMKFLWKKFDARQYSIYCVSYRAQDNIFASFQGENILSGLNCRLEGAGFELFGIMHTLFDFDNTIYKVVGAVIMKGQEPPPQWQSMPDFEDYSFVKADTKDPLVRQFVASLLTSVSPVPQYSIVSTRELII